MSSHMLLKIAGNVPHKRHPPGVPPEPPGDPPPDGAGAALSTWMPIGRVLVIGGVLSSVAIKVIA
jgi:hypothetical protein